MVDATSKPQRLCGASNIDACYMVGLLHTPLHWDARQPHGSEVSEDSVHSQLFALHVSMLKSMLVRL
jgi:hypothetical protein